MKVNFLRNRVMYAIELFESKDGPRFRIVSSNGKTIASSEAYASKSSRQRTVNKLYKDHNFLKRPVKG
jgi:uncharacterized protein YegP (UPF0339 family)